MRIRRENKGKDIVVNCAIEIDKAKADMAINDESMLAEFMNFYGIPASVEMMTRLMRCVVKDMQSSEKKSEVYRFTLIGQRD